MAKLHQVLPVLKNRKNQVSNAVTKAYQKLQKPGLTEGLSRTYAPLNDGDTVLPPENKPVLVRADQELQLIAGQLASLFNLTYEVEDANTQARADVVVDGQTLISQAPVTYLLFLEKQITDWRTIVSKLPVLDPSQEWLKDQGTGLWRGEQVQTVSKVKVPEVVVRYPATDKHPAQTEIFQKDVPQGTWTSVPLSGAIPLTVAQAILARADAVLEAVKMAREKANQQEVISNDLGAALTQYLLNG